MNCVDCKAAGIEAAATRVANGKGYCSSHARKYFPVGAQMPPANQQILEMTHIHEEEKQNMPAIKNLDWDAITADYQGGMSADQCAAKYGCHHTTVRNQLAKRGIYKPGTARRKAAHTHQAIVPVAPKVAAIERPTGETPVPLAANSRTRCRVAMFEVEGDATSVQHAVDAIKAALESRI